VVWMIHSLPSFAILVYDIGTTSVKSAFFGRCGNPHRFRPW
jgi:hypothetical protein